MKQSLPCPRNFEIIPIGLTESVTSAISVTESTVITGLSAFKSMFNVSPETDS
ncbi:hypothetical protein [uncultured Duncaniella sp.]|uniref:hypothetical protein n=1 Tax=uncultured Duncaniella sp. TaxID=2768039 RepID=UPI0026F0908C|nr:hypothetical protein [uncultured Duncaniella sp.]